MEVLIADDHAIFRKGLRHLIEGSTEYKISAEASNGGELLTLLRKKKPDMVILDINMPGINGLEALKSIRSLYPELPVLVLSMYPEEQYSIRAYKAGCNGYVSKGGDEEELLIAINQIIKGRKYISPSVAENILSIITNQNSSREKGLSDREFTVLKMIANGNSLTDIAGQLSLSIKTVSTYRTRILKKLNLKSNSDLIRFAMQNKLIDSF